MYIKAIGNEGEEESTEKQGENRQNTQDVKHKEGDDKRGEYQPESHSSKHETRGIKKS